ncbi:hypothetical protein Tco_0781842 [Tanacetum coccineum]
MPHSPPLFINQEEDEVLEEISQTRKEHGGLLLKVHLSSQKAKQRIFVINAKEIRHPDIPYPFRNDTKRNKKERLGFPSLFHPNDLIELANRDICTPKGIARDVFVSVGKFTFLADFVIVNYESDPRGVYHSSSLVFTFMRISDYFLEEFADELAHITFPPGNDDLPFDAESDLLELEYLLNHDPVKDMDSIFEDSVDENSLDDNLDDTISEMFTDEHALDYSSPPL